MSRRQAAVRSHGRSRPCSGRLRAGANTVAQAHRPDASGFWLGMWHGSISPITFLISLFNSDMNIYEVNNNGNWYNFGLMLGVAVVFSGSAGSSRAVRFHIVRLSAGRIVEWWGTADLLGALEQLGARILPPPA
jgi:hypothetical protein